ncbi:MAG: alpha-amylase family glycosyl hydrolase, partial [Actinomycetota bacterium]
MKWWESATFYEIYLRSFADGNGDGVGDLIGLRSRLEYLKWLGVSALWITPFYPSPMADHGYDVSDYRSVDPLFGSIEDIDGVIEDAHRINMRVIVDFVPNHTSDRHPWFQNAVSDPRHPDRDKYIFRDPAPDGGPPNNWVSVFGGPAWSLDERSGQYYLHLFAPEQPDLNWRNPEVHEYFDETLKFWLDRGIDGFRIDVAHGLFKDEQLRDQPNTETPIRAIDQLYAFDQPEVHDVYRRWRRIVDSYPGDRVLVGEVFIRDPKRVASYVRSDELHLAFNFFLLGQPWDSRQMRPAIEMSMAELGEVGARVTWVLSNHDLTRHPTRYGGGETGLRRARAAVPFLLALPGAVFLYQGEELGLEEALVPDHLRADPIFLRTSGQMAGRDGCRIPIPWEEQSPGYGFSSA